MPNPNLIELDDAVSRIRQACDDYSEGALSPFFFMVGAGISCPSVPLASEIVSQCKQVAQKYGRSAEPKLDAPIAVYSHWFQTAYAEPDQRQRYLRKLIEGKSITHANFRLAHLLLNQTISNIVVTPNFDDYLSKALTLFGKTPIVCDHPQTVGRINLARPILQIVHLHGTYWFYDCCNLRGELEDRARQSQQTTSTMASLLDNIFWDRSPLVIGYSGWEGDVFMEALKRRLARPLSSNVYWFCYQRSCIEAIPDRIKNNPNVYFVIPSKMPILQGPGEAIEKLAEFRQESVEQMTAKSLATQKDEESLLPADTVLAKLIRAFDLQSPALTQDPLSFFAQQLVDSLPQDDASDTDTDIYAIKKVIERVRRAQQRESEETVTVEPTESILEQVRDALRRADYREVIKQVADVQLSTLTTEALDELSEAMWSAAMGLYDNSEEQISAYTLVVTICDKLSEMQTTKRPALQERSAEALFNKGFRLGELNRSEEAIKVYDEVVQRFGESTEPALHEQVAGALVNKGLIVDELNRSEEAINLYDEVVQRFGESTELPVRKRVATALFNKGVTLSVLNLNEEAIEVYDEVVQRYGESPESALREQVAMALVNKGSRFGVLNLNEEAIKVYDEVVQRYGESTKTVLRDQVAMALVNKGNRLGVLNRGEEAISAYDKVVQRFGESTEPELRERVSKALFNKGLRLGLLNRSEEEIKVYDELVQRFGESTESALRERVARALFNKGITLGALSRNEEAIKAYEEIVQRFGESTEPASRQQVAAALNGIGFRSIIKAKACRLKQDEVATLNELQRARKSIALALERSPDNGMMIGNDAYIAFLLGEKDEARLLMSRAIALGGETLREDELKDADINRLPEDDEFCDMVRSIPLPSA